MSDLVTTDLTLTALYISSHSIRSEESCSIIRIAATNTRP